jgi:hypothetical protein
MTNLLTSETRIFEEFKSLNYAEQLKKLETMTLDKNVSGPLIQQCREHLNAFFDPFEGRYGTRIIKNGQIIRESKNLRGMLDYARVSPVVKIETIQTGICNGSLRVIYADGAESRANFASYHVMIDFVRNRRSWRTAKWDKNGFPDVGYLTKPGIIAGGI